MKKWGMALCAPGWFCLFAALLLMVVVNCGTNDGIYRELQEANGLPEAAGVTQEEMERLRAFPSSGGSIAYPFAGDCRLYRNAIKTDSGQTMELLLLKAGLPLEADALSQIVDAARICINIWGRKHGEVAIHELVRAILQDEPMKMYRLAEILLPPSMKCGFWIVARPRRRRPTRNSWPG